MNNSYSKESLIIRPKGSDNRLLGADPSAHLITSEPKALKFLITLSLTSDSALLKFEFFEVSMLWPISKSDLKSALKSKGFSCVVISIFSEPQTSMNFTVDF